MEVQRSVKDGFDTVNSDLKSVYNGLGKYSRALDKVPYPVVFRRSY